MKTVFAALLVVGVAGVAVSGCRARDQNAADTTKVSADTTVTNRKVQDTTIVRHDTTIHTDTIKKMGPGADSAARARKSRP